MLDSFRDCPGQFDVGGRMAIAKSFDVGILQRQGCSFNEVTLTLVADVQISECTQG